MQNLLPFIQTSGISLPLFALSSKDDFGIGDFRSAYLFIDFLEKSSQSVWKMLPIHETTKFSGYSPYDPVSSFAIDPIYIDIYKIPDVKDLLSDNFLNSKQSSLSISKQVLYEESLKLKTQVLRKAFETFYENEYELGTNRSKEFKDFVNMQEYWIYDYALYKVLMDKFDGKNHLEWEKEYKDRHSQTVKDIEKNDKKSICYHMYVQWIAHFQLEKLKSYANSKGVFLVGDIPFYPGIGSVEVWTNPQFFQVNPDLTPKAYGGSPSDDFTREGQRWDVGVFDWSAMAEDMYKWFYERANHVSHFFDGLRLDHFRGYIKYWHIDVNTNVGTWRDAAGEDFLNDFMKEFEDKSLTFVFGENLGVITEDVKDVQAKIDIDGYIVFISSYKDLHYHNVSYNNIIETTTHDNPPLKLWWTLISEDEKRDVIDSVSGQFSHNIFNELDDFNRWKIIERVLSHPFSMRLIPIQDILGSAKPINIPGTTKGNWLYRMEMYVEDLLSDFEIISKLDLYSSVFNINKYYVNFEYRSVPRITGKSIRKYKVGETIRIWALCREESELIAVTNVVPVKGDIVSGEYVFDEVETTPYGNLYLFHTKAKIPGDYYFTIKKDGDYLGEFENDLHIIIE